MKKLLILLFLCILAGCQSKATIEVDYVYPNHREIVESTLVKIDEKTSDKILFDDNDSVDVFYTKLKDSNVEFSIVNHTDYYYSGEIDFDVCEFKISFDAIVPHGEVSQTISCPNFDEDSEYSYYGQLYERNEEHKFDIEHDYYIYEDDEEMFDYLLKLDDITNKHLIELTDFLYTENILSNYDGEMWIRVYPMDKYEETYEKNTEESWNELDSNYIAGKIWLDTANDIAEVYSKDDELVERINYAKK